MNREDIQQALNRTDLFHDMGPEDLAQVLDIAEPVRHQAEEDVVRVGDPSDSFHVVADGEFDVYVKDELLRVERHLTILKPGEMFGDMGVLTGRPRGANVRARGPATSIRFPGEAFRKVLESHPGVAVGMAETLAHRLAAANEARDVPLVQLAKYDVDDDIIRRLPLTVIQKHLVLPLLVDDGECTLAVVDAGDLVARNTASSFLEEFVLRWVCISRADFDAFAEGRLVEIFQAPAPEETPAPVFYFQGEGVVADHAESEAAKALDDAIRTAIDNGASDLHFEPGPQDVEVRARIDGRMTEIGNRISFEKYRPIASRVKVVSELDLAERRLPQDAALRVGYKRRTIDMRVSTLPTPNGESVVCRLQDQSRRSLEIRELIVDSYIAEIVEGLFRYPSGLVLVTGPTGSGKTTTLYAGLRGRLRATPTIKLVTAEDPIEYELDRATQVQVHTEIGLSFERILRSLLRQDPDVVLIGEMRDEISMNIGLEASLTGHLVVSSLHTNSAVETVMRLRQRGAEPYVIASSLKGVVSQRLVARLCGACSEKVPASDEVIEALRSSGILEPDQSFEMGKAVGCPACRGSGRRGRLGLYEVLVMSDELRSAIEERANYAKMLEATPPGTYLPMRRYAAFALEKGLVAPEDVLPLFPALQEGAVHMGGEA